ncbi:MAG: 16S rRNA (cytosine(967)-C(5))-methyltransferase RsmB [Limisphaerales bacterium]
MTGHYCWVQDQKPREIAFRVLRGEAGGRAFAEARLDAELNRGPLSPKDRALAQELVYGVVRMQATLDWLIAQKTGDRPQKLDTQVLLRLGLYQLLWLDRVPDHAAVFETVALAQEAGLAGQAGFINAILRGYTRERDATRQRLEELKTSDPAIAWSHPQWLVKRWTDRWGTEATTRLLEWNNTAPRTFARINTLRVRAVTIIDRWRLEEKVEYNFGRWDWIPENLVFELAKHPPLDRLESFKKGWFYIQDPSTLLAVHLLDPRPGQAILDLCAAPGGKTTFIAQQLEDDCQILAQDVSTDRLKMLNQNCDRLGVGSVESNVVPANPADAPPGTGHFDRVLVDAPCSNTGVLRRRLELRWRLQPSEIARLAVLQAKLLTRAATHLKPGGILVYSTCSLEPEENGAIIQEFLARHPHFRLTAERTLTPFHDRVDGAYAARLEPTAV